MSGALPLRPALWAAASAAGRRVRTFAAPRLDPQASAFALSTLIAILLALFIAFSLDLPRPLWAVLTVFFLGKPQSGQVRSRSLYRLLGTLVGAGFAVLVAPALSPSPELLCLALAVWLGAGLFLSLLDRSPAGYVPMLAGYTASIIVLSDVQAPGLIFDTALARVEEISLGIFCTSFAHAVFWPREVTAVLNRRIAQVLGGADRWLAEMLAGRVDVSKDRGRLAADVTDLELLCHHLDFDTARLRPSRKSVRALLDDLSALTTFAADLEDRLQLLRRDGAIDVRLERLAAEAEAWLRAGGAAPLELFPREKLQFPLERVLAGEPGATEFIFGPGRALVGTGLCARAQALEAEFQAGQPDWRGLVHASAAGRLAEVLAIVQDAREQADRLRRGAVPKSSSRKSRNDYPGPSRRSGFSWAVPALRPEPVLGPAEGRTRGGPGRDGVRRPLHRDLGLAAFSGVVSAVALLGVCALWIVTAWPEGGGAASFVAIFCCLFATQDDPAPTVAALGRYLVFGIALAFVYQFLILPQVDGFVMLGAVLTPPMLAIGYVMAKPAHSIRGLGLAIGFGGGISPHTRYSADLADFLNGNLALVVGVVLAFAVQRLVRVIDAQWNGRRIARRGRRQVAALARARGPADRAEQLSLGLDRLGLINARLRREAGAAEALNDLRVGLEVIDLQRLRQAAPARLRQALDDVLAGVAMTFGDRGPADPESLGSAIDRALWACAAEVEGEPRRRGLAALVGLRRSLGLPGARLAGEAA
jgi:uncharacterized membrane protein YccC